MTQTQTLVRYVVRIPSIPGPDPIHVRQSSALREVRAAVKAGHAAEMLEVLIRPRRRQ